LESIKKVIKTHTSAPQKIVIDKLNPIIVGWANNFSHVVSKKTFNTVDYQVWIKLWRWSIRRHPNKGLKWIKNKYFQKIGTRKWVFSTKVKDKTHTLKRHADTKIVRHIKVKGTKNVYDGDKVYWSVRGLQSPTVSTRVRTLLKKQNGKCTWCNRHSAQALQKK
jgi:RNA-directed DNA polymerase